MIENVIADYGGNRGIMRFKAIIFDFEGTLVNFQWKVDEAVKEVKKLLALESSVYALLFNEAVEKGLREIVDKIYEKYDFDALSRWKLKEEGIIQRISEMGLKTALVTNIGRKALKIALEKFDLSFDVVVTRDDVSFLKPSPEGLRKAMKLLGERKILFVGDSTNDVLAARNVGIPIAVIKGGEGFEGGADFVLPSLRSLLPLLKERSSNE